ncbi:MAG: ATPase domain-containing protein, partial [Polyangia bacterium]
MAKSDHVIASRLRNRICLDYPLDVLLNRECRLQDYEEGAMASARRLALGSATDTDKKLFAHLKESHKLGSLVLPGSAPGDTGTGNIVIAGRPGTGKSTLALQMAVACTWVPNRYSSMFISLEERVESVIRKCNTLGWGHKARKIAILQNVDESSSDEEMGRVLERVLTQPSDCRLLQKPAMSTLEPCATHRDRLKKPNDDSLRPRILFPSLSPRVVAGGRDGRDDTFEDRYAELERLVCGAEWLRMRGVPQFPELRMICIDSLSALGERPLGRDQVQRILALINAHGCICVLTAEQGGEAENAALDVADVVIRLSAERDAGYWLRYLEIEKSRHQHQVYGLHPFKVRSPEELSDDDSAEEAGKPPKPDEEMFQALMVSPSVHHVLAATRRAEGSPVGSPPDPTKRSEFDIGVDNLKPVLLEGLRAGSIVTAKGPRGTYKSRIARNFLLAGIARGESVLLVTFGEAPQFTPDVWQAEETACPEKRTRGWLRSKTLLDAAAKQLSVEGRVIEKITWKKFQPEKKTHRWLNDSKRMRHFWRFGPGKEAPLLVELD